MEPRGTLLMLASPIGRIVDGFAYGAAEEHGFGVHLIMVLQVLIVKATGPAAALFAALRAGAAIRGLKTWLFTLLLHLLDLAHYTRHAEVVAARQGPALPGLVVAILAD